MHSARTGRPCALILIDIDRFRLLNFRLGDSHSDLVLSTVADTLRGALRPRDALGRWGDQEFLAVLAETTAAEAHSLAEGLRVAVDGLRTLVRGESIQVSISAGVAGCPHDADVARQVLAAADSALHYAQESGRNRVTLATDLDQHVYGVGVRLEAALREQRVRPAYQPIVDLRTGQVVAQEALARIVDANHPGKVLTAAEFMDTARRLQLSYQIDRAVILSTFARCVAALGRSGAPLSHFVNISASLLQHPAVVDEILAIAQRYCAECGLCKSPAGPVVIEMTERELLGDLAAARGMLNPFLNFGLRLALDDFGSGYSSFNYLAELPFSFLKIEGSLIRQLRNPKTRAIVQGIQRIATDLKLTTVAEYIETPEIADIARDLGIDWGQGYHFGRPVLG